MAWLRIDDGFCEHRKIIGLRDRAFRVHVAGLCYCARNLTDGYISQKAVKILAVQLEFAVGRHINELVAAGLWNPDSEGGYEINDYLSYNPDAASVRRRRADRSAAGKKGADSRWNSTSHNKSDGNSHSQEPSAPVPVPSPTRLKAVPADEIEIEVEKLFGHIRGVDDGTWGVLCALARKLPLSSVAKVRESCQHKGSVGAGYAVNALKAELADLEESA